mmetsp:Transcript_9791/g.34114  ORF Transcript_9791/g.34114 Transcript_9791/m.34114 type:complete len:247 (-) Transcript_9791:272-1012(-)
MPNQPSWHRQKRPWQSPLPLQLLMHMFASAVHSPPEQSPPVLPGMHTHSASGPFPLRLQYPLPLQLLGHAEGGARRASGLGAPWWHGLGSLLVENTSLQLSFSAFTPWSRYLFQQKAATPESAGGGSREPPRILSSSGLVKLAGCGAGRPVAAAALTSGWRHISPSRSLGCMFLSGCPSGPFPLCVPSSCLRHSHGSSTPLSIRKSSLGDASGTMAGSGQHAVCTGAHGVPSHPYWHTHCASSSLQ